MARTLHAQVGRLPLVLPPGGTTTASSVSQHGLTVTFDTGYEVGQFVTGDWFVVGSPVVTELSPAWDGLRHGASVNPPVDRGGYHTAVGYDPALNVAADLPRQLGPGESLVHTHGWLQSDPGVPDDVPFIANPGALRPCLRDSMVLTVLDEAPPAGTFRPPYVQGPKWLYSQSQLNLGLLADLAPVGSTPPWATIEASIARSWAPDHGYGWNNSRYWHPYNHMPDYAPDLTAQMYRAVLMLQTAADEATKLLTALKVVQYGIDTLAITRLADEVNFQISGVAPDSGSWWADMGGHGLGRSLPALVAKKLLGDPPELQAIWDLGPLFWGDEGQIWESDGDPSHDPWRSVGEATWGERAQTRPTTRPGVEAYRTCCTTRSTMGGVLAAHAMGVMDEWDRPGAALSDYVDWYVDVDQAAGGPFRAYYAFFAEMWDTHRASLG